VFSDYREVMYNKKNIDFHAVKHHNVSRDTLRFFDMFFTKYIHHAGVTVDETTKFIFIMKKLYNYDDILNKVLKKYNHHNIQFVIIEDRFTNNLLERNKDDFLCQYFFTTMSKENNCFLISNDKYRDKNNYIHLFDNDIVVSITQLNNDVVQNCAVKCTVKQHVLSTMIDQSIKRRSIPKRQLISII
jgi:hypothetical protein